MKLEVSNYVRYNTHLDNTKIGKIVNTWIDDLEYDTLMLDLDNDTTIKEFDVLKASHNIIDLIEVGDVIKWKFYKNGDDETYKSEVDYEKRIIFYDDKFELKDIHIVSILTHEQFEREAYKV